MGKCYLIMDMPSSCSECPLKVLPNAYSSYRCIKTKEIIESTSIKPTWCPLREVPQKKETKTLSEFLEEKRDVKDIENFVAEEFMKYGYNACIDEILGGGE